MCLRVSFTRLILAWFEQLNTNIQGISHFFFTTFMAPVLDEVFRLLRVSKHLYTHGIPEQLSRQWPGTGPDSSQHLKQLGYYTLVCFLFCFLSFRLDKLFVAIQLYWNFKRYCFCFFPNSALPNQECSYRFSLYMDVYGNCYSNISSSIRRFSLASLTIYLVILGYLVLIFNCPTTVEG